MKVALRTIIVEISCYTVFSVHIHTHHIRRSGRNEIPSVRILHDTFRYPFKRGRRNKGEKGRERESNASPTILRTVCCVYEHTPCRYTRKCKLTYLTSLRVIWWRDTTEIHDKRSGFKIIFTINVNIWTSVL